MANLAQARLDDEHIAYAHGEVPGWIDAEVFLFVAGADDFNHRHGYLLPGLVDVGRLGAEDGNVGALERAIGEEQAGIGEMEAATARTVLSERRNAGADPINELLVSQAGQEPPGVHAAGDFELDLAGSLAGEAIKLGGNIGGSGCHSTLPCLGYRMVGMSIAWMRRR